MSLIDICHASYKEWALKLGISDISDINRIISEGKSGWLVNICEVWHEQNISEIAKDIKDDIDNKRIVFVTGPSSSGKTSFTNKLQLHLRVLGIKSILLSLDNYYLEASKVPLNEEGEPDFEALEAIDYERFNENVYSLIKGEETVVPIFDFAAKGNRMSETRLSMGKDEVILVEGIHAFNPALIPQIPSKNKYKVYCSALTCLSRNDGSRIKSRTTRLIRRLTRDYQFRNTSLEHTLNMWDDVERGGEKYIYPYTEDADVVFNSSVLYEFALHKAKFNAILKADTSEKSKEHIELLSNLADLVNGFSDLNPELVPHNSIIREFIGGSSLDI